MRLHERVEASVAEGAGPDELVESLIRMVDEFQVGSPTDDVTIVALARSSATGPIADDATVDSDRLGSDDRTTSASPLGAR